MKRRLPWLWATAAAHPGNAALSTDEGSFDYGSLATAAERVAHRLAALDVGPGSAVAALLRPGRRFVELMHAEAKPVRQTLRDIFSQRIGTVLQQGA